MCLTDLVTDRAHLLQGPGGEVELLPCARVDGVDYQVGVEMGCVHMGGHKYLAAGEEALGQLQGNLVGLSRSYILMGREGLDVLVEEGAVGFAVQILGGHEDLLCRLRHAVHPSEVSSPICVQGLLALGDVPDDAAHGAGSLLGRFNEAACRHGRSHRPSL